MSYNIAAVILNYNHWQDTIACLGSLLSSAVEPCLIIVVDNASSHNDLSHIEKYLLSLNNFECARGVGGRSGLSKLYEGQSIANSGSYFYLVQSSRNRGYAAGNNIGIKLALSLNVDGVWLLNNDTVVTPSAFAGMCQRMADTPGMCGCLVVDYENAVECRGGGYISKWTGIPKLNGQGMSIAEAMALAPEKIEAQLSYIHGASLMVSASFIKDAGLMYEGFYLYYEEQDWAWRAKNGYRLTYAPDAVVYHQGGASTGWSRRKFSFHMLKVLLRSRLLLITRHAPYALPVVLLTLWYSAIRMVLRRLVKR